MFKIGIDLDNTIINYDHLFYGNALKLGYIKETCPPQKNAVKDYIHKNYPHAQAHAYWIKIQSVCYGNQISQANICNFFFKTIKLLIKNNCSITIISHKTQKSFHNKSIDLRQHALDFLKSHQIVPSLIPYENILFCNTLEEKISKIQKTEQDFFIDDHPLIISAPLLSETNMIFLNRWTSSKLPAFYSWEEIFNFFTVLFSLNKSSKITISSIEHTHRNRLFCIANGTQKWIIKIFSKYNQKKKKHIREYNNLKSLERSKLYTPTQAKICGNVVGMSFLSGAPLTTFSSSDFSHLLSYIDLLWEKDVQCSKQNGSDHRESINDYLEVISQRLSSLKNHDSYAFFLEKKEELFSHVQTNLKKNGLEIDTLLSENQRRFCHSDLSATNILKENDQYSFIDFECAGQDDPAKFLADLILHPQNQFTLKQAKELVDFFIKKIEKSDPSFPYRFLCIYELVAFEWELIKHHKTIKLTNTK